MTYKLLLQFYEFVVTILFDKTMESFQFLKNLKRSILIIFVNVKFEKRKLTTFQIYSNFASFCQSLTKGGKAK